MLYEEMRAKQSILAAPDATFRVWRALELGLA